MGGTFRKTLMIGGGLIAAYLILTHAKGSAQVTNSAGSNSVSLVKAFQGR